MIFDLIDYILGEIKMIIYKMIYRKRFRYHFYGKFSTGFQLRMFDKSVFEAGKNVVIRDGVKIRCNNTGKVILADGVGLNNNCLINSMDKIVIGKDTIIGQDVKMYDHDHDYKREGMIRNTGFKTAPIVIGENVWIGASCVILKGSHIGSNSVIGAGTVIKGEIAENSVVYSKMEYMEKPYAKE